MRRTSGADGGAARGGARTLTIAWLEGAVAECSAAGASIASIVQNAVRWGAAAVISIAAAS